MFHFSKQTNHVLPKFLELFFSPLELVRFDVVCEFKLILTKKTVHVSTKSDGRIRTASIRIRRFFHKSLCEIVRFGMWSQTIIDSVENEHLRETNEVISR